MNSTLEQLGETGRIAKNVFGPDIRCEHANTRSGVYNGRIVYNDAQYYLQQISPKMLVAHSASAIEQPLMNGQTCSITYTNQKPSVRIREAKSNQRQHERDR